MTITIDTIQDVVATCVQVAMNLGLLCVVFKNRQKRFGFSYGAVLGITGICCLVTSFLLPGLLPYIDGRLLFISVFCLLTVIPCRILYQGTVPEFVFCYFIMQSYIDNCFLVTKVVQGLSHIAFMEHPLSYMVIEGVLFMITLPAVLWFLKYRLRLLIDTTKEMDFWRYIWILPVALYVVYRLGISQNYTTLAQVWAKMDLAVPISWILGTILIYFIIVGTLLDTVRSVEEREKLEAVNQQLLMQREQYRIIQQNIDDTRRIRHDLHHQILGLKDYVEREDMDGIRKYLYAYLERLHLKEPVLYCENYAINTIIQYYADLAGKESIHLVVNLELPAEPVCSQSDLILVVGRLLEHAVEVSRRKLGSNRYIDFRSRMQGSDILVVLVKTSGGVQGDPENLFAFGQNQELGRNVMASVCKIAEKYHGVTRFEQESGEFEGYVLLNREQAEKSKE